MLPTRSIERGVLHLTIDHLCIYLHRAIIVLGKEMLRSKMGIKRKVEKEKKLNSAHKRTGMHKILHETCNL